MRQEYITFGKPEILEQDICRMTETIRSGWLSTGPQVHLFEEALREYIGCKHVVAVGSCTAGLYLSLLCKGIGKGDEVIVPSLTFCATVNVVEHVGATPVFVDVEPDTYCMNPTVFEENISEHTKAVIPVHFGGLPCDMDRINHIAEQHDVLVVEDAAHALGSRYHSKMIGAENTCCFSFYPTKNITTIEGGAVATDDASLAEMIRVYSNHGLSRDAWKRYSTMSPSRYQVVVPGYKYNMTDVGASLGLSQLQRIDMMTLKRRTYAGIYRDILQDVSGVELPSFKNNQGNSWHLFPILVEHRDLLRQRLHESGVGSGIHYEAVHLQPYYKEKYPSRLPRTEHISETTLSLPLQSMLSSDDIHYIGVLVQDNIRGIA